MANVYNPPGCRKHWTGHLRDPAAADVPLSDATKAAQFGYDFTPAACGEPTAAPPGSPEKVAVLIARAEAGVELFHPGDAADYENAYPA